MTDQQNDTAPCTERSPVSQVDSPVRIGELVQGVTQSGVTFTIRADAIRMVTLGSITIADFGPLHVRGSYYEWLKVL